MMTIETADWTRCGACGAENPPGFKFCGQCGRRLGETAGRAGVPEAAVAADREKAAKVPLEDLIEIVAEGELAVEAALEDLIEIVDEDEPVAETVLEDLIEIVAEGEADGLTDEQAPAYLVCQVCELDNLPDAMYCRLCGAVVAPAGAPCPACGCVNERGSLFCEKCGERLGLADLL